MKMVSPGKSRKNSLESSQALSISLPFLGFETNIGSKKCHRRYRATGIVESDIVSDENSRNFATYVKPSSLNLWRLVHTAHRDNIVSLPLHACEG